jgi:hypothetical protein
MYPWITCCVQAAFFSGSRISPVIQTASHRSLSGTSLPSKVTGELDDVEDEPDRLDDEVDFALNGLLLSWMVEPPQDH